MAKKIAVDDGDPKPCLSLINDRHWFSWRAAAAGGRGEAFSRRLPVVHYTSNIHNIAKNDSERCVS